MKIVWTSEAQQDRADIWDYIALDNPQAAAWIDELFSEAVARLSEHPEMGRPGKVPGTRELIPHESYRLVYEVSQDVVWVLALVHTARQWPPIQIQKHKQGKLAALQTAKGIWKNRKNLSGLTNRR